MAVHSHKAFGAQHPGREALGNVVAGIDVDLIVIRVCKSGAIGSVPLHQRLQSLAVAAGSRFRHRGQVFLVGRGQEQFFIRQGKCLILDHLL